MATANDMYLTQNEIINNVHIPSSPSRFVITDEFIYDNQQSARELINLRDFYAFWARKLSIVPATIDEYADISAELRIIHNALLAAKERMILPLFWLPTSIEALDGRATRSSNSCGLYSKRDCCIRHHTDHSQQENFKKFKTENRQKETD
ncbi:hypothetical protein TNCV_3474771 [Trichonephila clavipes]|nr:hypothetical protein TNCV_3474771 [Trichonephila clavipes]